MNTTEAILGVFLVCAGGGLVFWQTKRQDEKTGPTVKHTLPQTAAPSTPVARRPARQMPIQTSAQLLAQAECQGMVEQIRTRLGLTPENYARDVAPLIANFVEFVQLLPASQSHHHAQPGGLLQHTLEVASHSLALREGYKLPKGTVPEEQIRLGPVWTFGLLVAALLHDIGKPVADVVVTLYGSDPNKPLKTWSRCNQNALSNHGNTRVGDEEAAVKISLLVDTDRGAIGNDNALVEDSLSNGAVAPNLDAIKQNRVSN